MAHVSTHDYIGHNYNGKQTCLWHMYLDHLCRHGRQVSAAWAVFSSNPTQDVHTHGYTHVYTYIHAHVYTYVYTHVYTHVDLHTCPHTCLHTCLHTCPHTCLHICPHTCLTHVYTGECCMGGVYVRPDSENKVCVDTCVDMCLDMCVDMCMDMCV